MIYGIGIDIVDVARIKEAVENLGDRFVNKILTEYEKKIKKPSSPNYFQELAGRFAAKEAFVKALKTGIRYGIKFRDIEIRNNEDGAPYLVITGKAKEFMDKFGIIQAHISISHIKTHACANVTLETE